MIANVMVLACTVIHNNILMIKKNNVCGFIHQCNETTTKKLNPFQSDTPSKVTTDSHFRSKAIGQ